MRELGLGLERDFSRVEVERCRDAAGNAPKMSEANRREHSSESENPKGAQAGASERGGFWWGGMGKVKVPRGVWRRGGGRGEMRG